MTGYCFPVVNKTLTVYYTHPHKSCKGGGDNAANVLILMDNACSNGISNFKSKIYTKWRKIINNRKNVTVSNGF